MRPFPAQYQMASDPAKNALARLTGTEAPPMQFWQGVVESRDKERWATVNSARNAILRMVS